MGLRLVLQPRPLCPALYAISVRRLGILPTASFRFRLTADTLTVQLTLPTTKRVVDFHHQAIAHGGRTKSAAVTNHAAAAFSKNQSVIRPGSDPFYRYKNHAVAVDAKRTAEDHIKIVRIKTVLARDNTAA